jgi:hypothetical protein
MIGKTIALATVGVVLVALLCSAFAQQPTKIPNAVEEPKLLPSVQGRYQPFTSKNELVLVDTQTGQCWTRSGGAWQDLGSPVKSKE